MIKKESSKTERYSVITARIPEAEHRKFKMFCIQQDRSMMEVIRELIKKIMEESQ